MSRAAATGLALGLFACSHAGAAECAVKGFEFVAAARDNMWPIVQAHTLKGKGACSVLDNAVISAGAVDGNGVTCEATFFAGSRLRAPWKLHKISFGGADFLFTSTPALPAPTAQVTVSTSVAASAATSLNVEQVVLTTSEPGCANWRDALKGDTP